MKNGERVAEALGRPGVRVEELHTLIFFHPVLVVCSGTKEVAITPHVVVGTPKNCQSPLCEVN